MIIGLILIQTFDSCQLKQLSILSEIEEYKKSQDPQQCMILVNKIILFNNECKSELDIVDCG